MKNNLPEVKAEIYGTRNSNLEPVLNKFNIYYIKNLWIISHIKSKKKMIGIESNNKKDIFHFENLVKKFGIKNYFFVFKDIDKNKIYFRYNQDKTLVLTENELKNYLLGLFEVNFISNPKKGSNEASFFSRFFREKMGKGFVLTDIDYYIPSMNIFIEEKIYLLNKKNGFISYGQYKNFTSIEGIKNNLMLMYSQNISNKVCFYCVELNKIKKKFINEKKWGKGYIINNLKKIDITEILTQKMELELS